MSEPGENLFRLLYRSRWVSEGGNAPAESEVQGLLSQSRAANAAVEVTGALMLSGLNVVQALEGDPDALETTFERICCDLRHTEVELLGFSKVDERAFGEWWMGCISADTALSSLFNHVSLVDGVTTVPSSPVTSAVNLMEALIRLQTCRLDGASQDTAVEAQAVGGDRRRAAVALERFSNEPECAGLVPVLIDEDSSTSPSWSTASGR